MRDEALDLHSERSQLDFDTWRLLNKRWHFFRGVEPHVDVANLVWNHRSCSSEVLCERVEELAAKSDWPLHWPETRNQFDNLIEWIDYVKALSQHPWRQQTASGETLEGGKEEQAVTSSLEDDNKLFSATHKNISSSITKFRRPPRSIREIEPWPHLYAPSDSFEVLWREVEGLAYGRAKVCRDDHEALALTTDELIQVARSTVWEIVESKNFNGASKFSTYVYRALTYAMSDYVNGILKDSARGRSESIESELVPDHADQVIESLYLREVLRACPDLKFVVSKECGIRDYELGEENVAVRRHRALKAASGLAEAAP